MRFAALENRRVAVWGFGREGRVALQALHRRLPGQALTLFCRPDEVPADGPEAGVEIDVEPPGSDVLASFDVIIKSPGISAYKPEVVAARKRGTVFTSGTALWFGENPQARVIAITGTKGKSTTAALTAHLARAAGVRTALAGNIGLPLLELDGRRAALWVIELSSFQTGEAGPLDVGVVTSLYEDHLDWHGTRERYIADKLKLAEVSRTLVVNAAQPDLLQRTAEHARRVLFNGADGWHVCAGSRKDEGNAALASAADAAICHGGQPRWLLSSLPVQGLHNAGNVCAALTALALSGIDADAVVPALARFRPLPHRLQDLGWHDGFRWINDSISTTPAAVAAALETMANTEVTLILGGHDRGVDWSAFAADIAGRQGLRIIVQGANGARIGATLRASGFPAMHEAADLAAAVVMARGCSHAGASIVLSPGSPSFDQFDDYADRGRQFMRLAGFAKRAAQPMPGLGIY